jgi:hypothetical protein
LNYELVNYELVAVELVNDKLEGSVFQPVTIAQAAEAAMLPIWF